MNQTVPMFSFVSIIMLNLLQANDARFKYKDDFTVVLQTFTKNITFPLKRNAAGEVVHDLSYLSHDCFHFSQKGYFRGKNFSSVYD